MKITLATVLLLSTCAFAQQPAAPPAPKTAPQTPHEAYLSSRVDEARSACKAWIVATSKDPDSVKFLDEGIVAFDKRPGVNSIYFAFTIMARNTYGAVLKHDPYCSVACKESEKCVVDRVFEL